MKFKVIKRMISVLLATLILVGSIPASFVVTFAEDDSIRAAHTINVFNIRLKQGATYYDEYNPENPSDDGTVSINDAYVWQAFNSNEGHRFVYNIEFSVSGEGTTDVKQDNEDEEHFQETKEAVEENFIEIHIPAHILKYKGDDEIKPDANGEYPDTIEMPVPHVDQLTYKIINGEKVYDYDHQFVYKIDDKGTEDEADDEYIIFNIQPVSAGVVYSLPFAYRMNKNTWEYQDLGVSEPCKSSIVVHSWVQGADPDDEEQKIQLTMDTREIPVYIDTGAEITTTIKRSESSFLTAEQAKTKIGYLGELDDNYRYMLWSITSNITNVTQKYDLHIDDFPTDITGVDAQGVSHTVSGEYVLTKMGGTFTDTLTGLVNQGRRVDYVLTRYPYEASDDSEGVLDLQNAPKTAVYSADNKVDVTLTPLDGQDKSTTANSEATFKFEVRNPVWTPVEENYTAEKWGIYNDDRRVTSKKDVSSYDLATILEDEEISGIKYETSSTAHAYGKTIASLNDEISAMIVPDSINPDGLTVIYAGQRKYAFNVEARTCYMSIDDEYQYDVEIPDNKDLTLLEMQKIAALDLANNYYGQKDIEYIFEDKTINLADIDALSQTTSLDYHDYRMDSVRYSYSVHTAEYNYDDMSFSEGAENRNLSDNDEENTLLFYVFVADDPEPQLAGSYNLKTNESVVLDSSLISSLSSSEIVFSNDTDVSGYQIRNKNKYFLIKLETFPSITLKPTEKVKNIVEPLITGTALEKKIAMQNAAQWKVIHDDGTVLLDVKRTGTDYLADIVRTSEIRKQALGEKISYKGNDGNVYQTRNDTLLGEYELAWQTRIAETSNGQVIDGQLKSNYPVPQQSGIFYDLLPAHCDIIEGSVNVYVDANGTVNQNTKALAPSSYEVLNRIDNYHNSGKKLLIIKINAPCEVSYTVTYVTVHSHEDIHDYGSYAVNTVAYQTGNNSIGDGYADDGGNYAVSNSSYMIGLDPDNNGAKRFIYAEATEDILALFPTSSGLYKKVATKSDPIYKKSGIVRNGETYTYDIRMKNDPSTETEDIAIMDSVENFRTTAEGERLNAGHNKDRDWNGQIVSFDLQGVEDKIAAFAENNPSSGASVDDMKLIVYVGDDNIDFDSDLYSVDDIRTDYMNDILAGNNPEWIVVDNWRNPGNVDMSEVSAFIVYTGTDFVLDKNDSLAFSVKMIAPDEVVVEQEPDVENGKFLSKPKTYNNIYRSFKIKTDVETYYYTHYDYTEVEYKTVGKLRLLKADSKTNEGIAGIEFNLSGVSDYGTSYDQTLISDDNGYVQFSNLERGSYTLIESSSDADHVLDSTPRQVHVDPRGKVTIITVDGVVVEDGEGNYTIFNEPRYHGEFSIKKVDMLSGEGIEGAVFNLSGTSIYNTKYDLTISAGSTGMVSFGDLEKGEYTLTEIQPADGYLPSKKNTYKVTSSGERNLVFTLTGENAVNGGTEYHIENEPTAEMTLQKVDEINKDVLDDAKFTLIADHNLNSTLKNLIDNVENTGWVKDGKYYKQSVDNSNTSTHGGYRFRYLPEGSYTLKEERAPEGYAANENEYTIQVTKNSDGDKLIVVLPKCDDMQYIAIKGNEFVLTDAEGAEYYRLLNEPEYASDKMVIKSWIGDPIANDFPSFHLSEEKPEREPVITTIYSGPNGNNAAYGLRKLVAQHQSQIKAFERVDVLPEGVTPTRSKATYTDTDRTDETGIFYAWWDDAEQKIKWWSDADIIYMPEGCRAMFEKMSNENMKTIDLSPFDFSRVQRMDLMFLNCTNLETIIFPDDIDTSKLKNMSQMFEGCNSLTSIDLSGFNTSSVTTMEALFRGCGQLSSVNVSNFDVTNVTNMHYMFADVGRYAANKPELDLSSFGTSAVTTALEMFVNSGATKIDLSNFSTPKLTNAGYLFSGCTQVKEINIQSFDTAEVTNVQNMFNNCSNVEILTVGPNFKLNAATNTCDTVGGGIRFNHLTHLKEFNGSQYIEWKGCQYLNGAFQNIGRDVPNNTLTLDLTGISGENITNMNWSFADCGAKEIDLSNFNTINVTDGTAFFLRCKQLEKLTVGENFNLNGVKISGGYPASALFADTFQLKEFIGSQYLQLSSALQINDLFQKAGRDVPNNTLTLDLSGITAPNATQAIATFLECGAQAIILSNLETSSITNMNNMFKDSKVKTVYVDPQKWSTDAVTAYSEIFNRCSNIVGGRGTAYRGSSLDYARVDGGSASPGYFTDIADMPEGIAAASTLKSDAVHSNALSATVPNSTTAKTKRANVSSVTQSADSDGYPKFEKLTGAKDSDSVEISEDELNDEIISSLNKKVFVFEYVTATQGTKISDSEYSVPETIYLTVKTVTEKDGKYYNEWQRYKYTEDVIATWNKVDRSGTSQWECHFTVHDSDPENGFYLWEDKVIGYNSTALEKEPLWIEPNTTQPAVITNSKEPVGSLSLAKTLAGTDSEKFSADTFWFKVTMKNADGTAYTMLPFDEEGVAYYDVRPSTADENHNVLISGIPVGCVYTVEEVDDENHPMPAGYEKSGVVSGVSGVIEKDTVKFANIENKIQSTNLSLHKSIELYKKTEIDGDFVLVNDQNDEDLLEWSQTEFDFKVLLTNLVKNQEYSYEIDGKIQDDKIIGSSSSNETTASITLKAGQTATILNLPVSSSYQISEEAYLADEESIFYNTSHYINGGNNVELTDSALTTSQVLKSFGDNVEFCNKKYINVAKDPETVEISVNKQWFNQNGELVTWDADGKASEGNYPSFLKIYLGRAIKIGDGDNALYMEIEPGFESYSLKPKENWSYTFSDLPKSTKVTLGSETKEYDYVYFISETVPLGFHNYNDDEQFVQIGDNSYLVVDENYNLTLKNQEDFTHKLSVAKIVTGNMGNKNKDFTFEIEFKTENGQPLTGTGFLMQFSNLFDETYQRNRTYTLENGKVSVNLPHGMKVEFLSLPQGTIYSIKETNSGFYTVKSGTYTGLATDKNVDELQSSNSQGINERLSLDGDTDYLFVNDRTIPVPTGVYQPKLFYSLIIFTVLAALALTVRIMIRKRKITH